LGKRRGQSKNSSFLRLERFSPVDLQNLVMKQVEGLESPNKGPVIWVEPVACREKGREGHDEKEKGGRNYDIRKRSDQGQMRLSGHVDSLEKAPSKG